MKILLIDNNPETTQALPDLLSQDSDELQLSIASSVAVGIDWLKQAAFDLLLLGLSNATTTLDSLKPYLQIQQENPTLPTLIIATIEDEALAIQAVEAGAQAYLLKETMTSLGLKHAIRQAVSHQKQVVTLRESDSRFLKMLQHSQDGFLIVDVANTIHLVNAAAERVLDQSSELLLNTTFPYPFEPDQLSELTFNHASGQIKVVEMQAIAIDWQHEPHYLIWLRDITKFRDSEATLRQIAVELKNRNEELDAFAHTVAHDLLTPLSLITGYAHLFEESGKRLPFETLQTYLHGIIWNGYKMQEIIQALLLLASTRQEDIFLEPIHMPTVMKDVRRRLAKMLRDSQAKLYMPSQWPTAWGYGPWVEEVWVNYISNAIKYGGSPPEIQLGVTEHDNDHIRFWVRDNGAGIVSEDQVKLFSAFPDIERNGTQGYGLGLSIVRRIMERLAGEAGFDNVPHPAGGSLFYFTLPIYDPTQQNAEQPPANVAS